MIMVGPIVVPLDPGQSLLANPAFSPGGVDCLGIHVEVSFAVVAF